VKDEDEVGEANLHVAVPFLLRLQWFAKKELPKFEYLS
jgi:hypothetical protein